MRNYTCYQGGQPESGAWDPQGRKRELIPLRRSLTSTYTSQYAHMYIYIHIHVKKNPKYEVSKFLYLGQNA